MPKKIEVQIAMQDKLSTTVDKVRGKIQQLTHTFGGFIKKLINLRNVAVVGTMVMIGRAIIGAAAKIEVFAKQLEIVSGSAAEANKTLAKMREFARTSPLETEDVVQSYVRLRAVGIEPTMKEMKILGGVAVMMNRQLTNVLQAFIGLNTRTLRRLGIQINRTGKMAIIESGNMRMEIENDATAIRVALLDMWEKRFPDAIKRAAGTTTAQLAIMKSEFFELSAVIGKEVLPTINKILKVVGKIAGAIRLEIEALTADSLEQLRVQILIKDTLGAEVKEATKRKIIGDELNKQLKKQGEQKAWILAQEERIEGASARARKGMEIGLEVTKRKYAELAPIINQLFQALTEIGKEGAGVGAGGDEDEDSGVKPGEKVEFPIYKGYAIGLKKRADLQKQANEDFIKQEEELIEFRKQLAEELRTIELSELEIEKLNYTDRLMELRWFYKKGLLTTIEYEALKTATQKEESDKRKAIAKQETWDQINNYMQFGSAINQLASMAVANAKMSAKKRQNILIALAVAEGAASAVTAAKAGWDSGVTVYDKAALAAAAVISALAMTGTQIATIKAQKFARGTSFAPGGMAIVGEEGPEAMFIPRGSQVMTNAQTRNNFGATNLSFNVNIAGDASDRTVEKLNSSLEQFGTNFTNAIRKGHIDPQRLGFVTV